ncbi:DUF2063 domain-containing protein [Rhodoferax sp.]|uniref:HvfC/BufC N-terminal domain-containing protein n=1 Tax=Rhodoferax sp. TaxID=50421 RepID=UPI00275A5091|nr:DNA-binding domain-containing protein [Rhodoferax sp.]
MNSQASFARALLDPGLECPGGLTTWNGSDPEDRFAVYRNNVTVSLVDALADTFPVVQELVGEEFFRAMARVFVQAHPPRSPVLAHYGASFADFVQSFAPAASLPYLSDVGRLEMCRVRAYHAADVPAAQPEALQAVLTDPRQLVSVRLGLHPSLQVVESRFAVFSIWAAHQGAGSLSSVDPAVAQTALVFRGGLDVEVLELTACAGQLVSALQRGITPVEAAAAAAANGGDPASELANAITLLIRFQIITTITTGDDHREHSH